VSGTAQTHGQDGPRVRVLREIDRFCNGSMAAAELRLTSRMLAPDRRCLDNAPQRAKGHANLAPEMVVAPLRIFAVGAVCAIAMLVSRMASAQPQKDVAYLADQLKNGTDFRVRTQAALALGASEDAAAVRPLCDALDDPNDAIRSAGAAGLGRLGKPDGLRCLRSHSSREQNPSVRSVLERSTKSLEGSAGGTGKPRPPGPSDTFYVALGPVTDKTSRGDKSIATLATAAMQEKLLSMQGYAVAPQGESAAAARTVLKKRKLKAFYLQARVEPPTSAGGDLVIQVRMTMWTYPGKALQGEFSPRLTMSGVSVGDRTSEDNLIRMAIDRAIESFAQVAASAN
jgi:hypothetical protein